MKSMMLSEKDLKEEMIEEGSIMEKTRYPYGLCIHIDDEMFSRLEVKEIPKVGDEFMILAKAVVKGVRKELNSEISDTSMDLQITDMDLKKEKKEKDTATELYGG